MKIVEIYKLQNDGTQRVIATCTLVGDVAVCEGEKIFVENLEREGIVDNAINPPQKLFPKDGLRFLEKLRFVFTSGYLNASEVKDE